MLTTHEYLQSLKIDRFPKETVVLNDYLECPSEANIEFIMREILYNAPVGKQRRYCNPTYHELKSKTVYWSGIGYFYANDFTYKKPVVVLEGEKDWLTTWYLWYNALWLQGVNNLPQLVNKLSVLWCPQVLLLVDQDEPADKAIKKISKREFCFDCRWILGKYKDVSDAYVAGQNLSYLDLEVIPKNNLFQKLGKRTPPKRTYVPKAPLDFASISADIVLENLYPQYRVVGDKIYDNGKITSGYRYWKSTNIIKDFSEKWRPEGNAWKIAFGYYKDKKATVEYLKRYL